MPYVYRTGTGEQLSESRAWSNIWLEATMLIRKPADLRHSDVTPKQFYLNRRRFLAAGSAIAGAWALPTPAGATMKLNNVTKSSYTVNEKITSREDITSYNNY